MSESEILERNAGQCLSEGEMMAYLGTSLSAKARHTLELHLSECPFCSDALDGFELLPSNRNPQEILQELTLPEPPESTESTARIRILFPWRIAAAFVLLGLSIATLYLLKPDTDSGIAEATRTQTVQPDKPLPNAPLTDYNKAETVTTTTSESESKNTKSVVTRETLSNELIETDAGGATEDIKALAVEPAKQQSDEPVVAEGAPKSENDQETRIGVQTRSEQREEHDASSVKMSESLAAVSKKSAASLTVRSDFENGIRAYESGKYKSCIELLNRREVLRESSVREGALWTLAQCQLNTGDTASARSSLTQVIRIKGRYLNEAKRQLELLK